MRGSDSMRNGLIAGVMVALLCAEAAEAREVATLKRLDAGHVELLRDDRTPVGVWLSDDDRIGPNDQQVSGRWEARTLRMPLPADTRRFVLLRGDDGATHVIGERVLPLAQASNFRDIGGYVTKDGRSVRWGKAYRSGAMPLLTQDDYALVDQLGLGTVIDLRTLDEREVTPNQVDDRTGALFVANDYGMKTLMSGVRANSENMYGGMEKLLAPQYRALFKRLIAEDGAVLYHCSAGQDRTGIATALVYDVLGVDRQTILEDYHLSTDLRRLQWEMPEINPEDFPGNFIVQYYVASAAKGKTKAEPLYSAGGASHLAQFFTYLDQQYGGSEAYVKQVLGLTDAEIARLRAVMLR